MSEKNRRILIIDDNASIHDDFRKLLAGDRAELALEALESELFGLEASAQPSYELSSALQGEEGLAMVREAQERGEPYALAFVDMRMPPGWDGVQTIQAIWEIDAELQVVICTAYSDHSWQEIFARVGTTDRLLILKKPFDAVEVCQLASAMTEKWDLARRASLRLEDLRDQLEEQTSQLRAGSERLSWEITERVEIENELQASETRYALAAMAANDGLWDWDLRRDRAVFGPRWKQLLGYSEGEVGQDPSEWFERVHPDDLPAVKAVIARCQEDFEVFQCEYRVRHRDGGYRWMLCRGVAVRDHAGRPARIVGSQTDITDRRLAEERIRHDALHDSLTGLANRALLIERVGHRLRLAKRGAPGHFALLFLDLDRFKWINDSLGHLTGDQLLMALSQRLLASVRESDLVARVDPEDVARVGGDEFVILLSQLNSEVDALRVAERLLRSLDAPLSVGERELLTSMSIGIAIGRPEYKTPEELLRDADTALYEAKAAGRGRYVVFDSGMHVTAMSRWWMENELRRAIEREELRLVYQPVICLKTGEVLEFEALLRWTHSEKGPISPGEFIPIAEETGLIAALGDWVLTRVLDQIVAWRELLRARPRFSVAVNVSGRQVSQPRLTEFIHLALSERGLSPECLRLEVTEGAVMDRGPSAEVISKLHAQGVLLHLDDFGTGYSSLSYLHRIPVEAVKVDRSFVNEMMQDATSASIVQTIITLAHTLGAKVIAEGVETREQLRELRRLGCEQAQGFLLSRPLEVPGAEALLVSPSGLFELDSGVTRLRPRELGVRLS